MIFFKIPDIKERIDMAVFPALQSGPHNHQVRALAAQLLEVKTLVNLWNTPKPLCPTSSFLRDPTTSTGTTISLCVCNGQGLVSRQTSSKSSC